MSRRITLVSTDAGPGHNCSLAIGLKKLGTVTTVWEFKNAHGLDYIVPDAKYGYQNIPKRGDDIIIVRCLTYNRLINGARLARISGGYKRTHIIITDGKYARDPYYYNKRFTRLDVITTGCKRHFRGKLKTKTYYQPFDMSGIDQTKNKKLTIAHSPFVESKFKEKGTEQIMEVVKGHNFDLITGVTWDECLQRKAKAHIFVDQIDHYDRDKFKLKKDYIWPALGKSGIEAMHLGCLVITYGKGYNTEIPAPPVAWVTDNFEEVLNYYINNPKEREELAQKGKEWALKYATPEYMAQTVLS